MHPLFSVEVMAVGGEINVEKVINYISSSGGYLSLADLLKHPSPLAKKSSVEEVKKWLETQIRSGEHRFVFLKGQRGHIFGLRIDLKKRFCLQYLTTGSCRSKQNCNFWHICKKYVERNCKDESSCRFSHDFHDEENIQKTKEIGLDTKPNNAIRQAVAGSFPQVCLAYLKNECSFENCPYIHACASVTAAVSHGTCTLPHELSDPHNKAILKQYGLTPPRETGKLTVVHCNVLVPKNQKRFEAGSDSEGFFRIPSLAASLLREKVLHPHFSQLEAPVNEGSKAKTKSVCQTLTKSNIKLPSAVAPIKVFNYVCSKGGIVSLSDLIVHPSPLAKSFAGQDMAAKGWIQGQSGVENKYRLAVVENWNGVSTGVRVDLRKKICIDYYRKGVCVSESKCNFWHICKGYIEDKCGGDCAQGRSHDFFDEANDEKTRELGLEKYPNGVVRSIVKWSLPQVCVRYLSNGICFWRNCPYLHVCANAVQGNSCQCELWHEWTDPHNKAVLQQYGLTPSKKLIADIVKCNVMIPKLADTSAGTSLSAPDCAQQSALAFKDKQQTEAKAKSKNKPRKRNRKSKQKPNNQQNLPDSSEEQSDSDDNENKDKPDFYSNVKFMEDPFNASAQVLKTDLRSGSSREQPHNLGGTSGGGIAMPMQRNLPKEENLIDFSDELVPDLYGVDAFIDDLSQPSTEPLSQLDDVFFNDWLTADSTGVLSQGSLSVFTESCSSTERSIDEKQVFEYICKNFKCKVPFSVIRECQDLFPSDAVVDVAAWFRGRPNRFILTENNSGEVDEVRAYSPKARVCFRYLSSSKGCNDPKCFRFHVCKHHLANGWCLYGKKCSFNHSHGLTSPHNKKLIRQLKLASFSEDQIRLLVAASVPEVCQDYNDGFCQRGTKCIGIHICKKFVLHRCHEKDKCSFGHQASLKTEHTKMVLNKYNLTTVPLKAIHSALLVPQVRSITGVNQRRNEELPSSGPYICLDFLLGHCSKQQLCEYVHMDICMPYCWQYRYTSAERWKSFSKKDNEDIERQYCDVNTTFTVMGDIMISPPQSLLIHPGEGDLKVDFVKMMGESKEFGDVKLRRLSTKSALTLSDHALFTTWRWYWLDEHCSWHEYGTGLLENVDPEKLETHFTRGTSSVTFKSGDGDHKLLFRVSPMVDQITPSHQFSSTREVMVRRRPIFRAHAVIEQLKSPLELQIPLDIGAKPETVLDSGRFPPHWTCSAETEEFVRVKLPLISEDYQMVDSLFRKSMSERKFTVLSIERVQNKFLWEKYSRKKEQMEKKASSPVIEQLLFHGTGHDNVETICEENIDWRVDEDRTTAFGQGAYFTVNADLSNSYCKEDPAGVRSMFLAEVLVGSYTKGAPEMRRPPPRGDSTSRNDLYDSCVDNVDAPSIFVLFNQDQYYPSYLMQYKMKSKVVC